MTSPARQQTPSVFSPLADGGAEPVHEPSPEIRDALLRDQAELQREVILWQRWIRYLAIVVLAIAAVLLSARPQGLAVLPLAAVSFGYIACVYITGLAVQRAPALTTRNRLAALLVTADLLTIGAVVYITSMPLVANRFLVIA